MPPLTTYPFLGQLHYKEIQTPWIQTLPIRSILRMPTTARRAKASATLREVFARNVRLVRTNAGVSQERLADEAGLDRTFVSSLERGVRNISIDNIELLAKALKTPAHHLLDPGLDDERGLDTSLVRAPRKARPYPTKRKAAS
jgi:ribosome-binding protein aMBF1 (putative translation factor)